MSDKITAIIWSHESEDDLDEIFKHYLQYNPDKASVTILNIIKKTEQLIFTKQYQVDAYDATCRRLFIDKKFRIVYTSINTLALIFAVYPNRANHSKIRVR